MSGVAPVAVLGGGVAGLAAAVALRRRGLAVKVFEAGAQPAGLAASFLDPEGFSYDFGAHFITNRLAAAVGVGARCRDVAHYGERVLIDGQVHSYPFGLLARPRYVAGGLRSLGTRAFRRRPATAADSFRAAYGRPLADRIAIPLVEAWSGAPADRLSPDVAGKLQNGIARTAYLKLASRVTRRAVACGYSHEMPENPWVWHVYPEGGVGTICGRMAADIGDCLKLNSPVSQILVEDGRVAAVRVHDTVHAVSAVVSTAPVPVLAKLVVGTDALAPLARFRYRPMVFVNLKLRGRGLLPDTVLWTPGKEFPFFRLTETTWSMPWLAPDGKTLVCADIGAQVGDTVWSMADEELGLHCVERLEPVIPDVRRRYLGCKVMRTPIAYPVYDLEYEAERHGLAQSTGVPGLYSIGRNGEFAHILMEDIYWRTRRQMRALADWVTARPPA